MYNMKINSAIFSQTRKHKIVDIELGEPNEITMKIPVSRDPSVESPKEECLKLNPTNKLKNFLMALK